MVEGLNLEKQMLDEKVWAVVGATPNEEKFGFKLYQRLKETGYEVYGVNPVYDKIGEDVVYENLSALPVLPQVIDMVVSPKRALPVLEEAAKLGIKYIWFQPGTHDDQVLAKADELGLEYVLSCVLVATQGMERVK